MVFKRASAVVVLSILFLVQLIGCSGNEANEDSVSVETAVTDIQTNEDSLDILIEGTEENTDVYDYEDSHLEGLSKIKCSSEIELGENLVINSSIETQTGYKTPYWWYNNTWGNNNPKFSYPDEGHTGDKCLKIEMTDYTDGDAKWYFFPLYLDAGDYVFSDYYKSDVDTKVMVRITTWDYKRIFVNLNNAPASQEWTQYTSTFTVPEGTQHITVFHMITQEGYLYTDDVVVSPYEYEGFNQGMVTISFDDGWAYNYETVLPVMQKYGFKSNQFYATNLIRSAEGIDPKDYIQPFIDAGHEIGSHTITHADLEELTDEELEVELEQSKLFLENYFHIKVNYFAAPYGIYDESINNKIMKIYTAHRTVDYGYNSKDTLELCNLKCMPIVIDTTAEDVEKWVQKAKEENLWLILLFHDIYDGAGQYGSTPQVFAECMQVIDDSNIEVVTITEALEIIVEEY